MQVAEGPIQPDRNCPHSGETIVECKRSELCDCFDFPEYDDTGEWIVYVRTVASGADADDVADAILVALVKALPDRSFIVGLERANGAPWWTASPVARHEDGDTP